jgi:hypothetical protein
MNLRTIVGTIVIPIMSAIFIAGGMASIAFDTTGCTPAQQAYFGQIGQIVLDDLALGKTRAQIEQDIGRALAGQVGVDVAIILDDVLTVLIDAGLIPVGVLPAAKTMLAEVHPVALAHRAAVKP